MYLTTQEQIFRLPLKEMEQLKEYLDFLIWKAKPQQQEGNRIAQEIISALKQSNELTIDDAYALLKTIKESEKSLPCKSPLDKMGSL